ncbi:MAG: GyrI-like domain-containing protein [Bacillota bacterium]
MKNKICSSRGIRLVVAMVGIICLITACGIDAPASVSEDTNEPTVVSIGEFQVVGLEIHGTLKEIGEQKLGKQAYQSMLDKAREVDGKVSDRIYMIELYPDFFQAETDTLTQIIGYEVSDAKDIPEGMVAHIVPASKYVKFTHKGLEAELGRTYDLLYGEWMKSSGNRPQNYDFEIWDKRYKPESSENRIDVHVALVE